jgi:hypothetical protein
MGSGAREKGSGNWWNSYGWYYYLDFTKTTV